MNLHPHHRSFFSSLILVVTLVVLPGIFMPTTSEGVPILQGTPNSLVYLPYVAKQYDPSEVPVFYWSTNFENCIVSVYECGFTYDAAHRTNEFSYYSIVDDPTGSGRGKLYRGVVDGGPPPVNEATDNGHRHRPHPDLHFPYIAGPFASELDVWVDTTEILDRPWPDDTGPWLSLLSFVDTDQIGTNELPPFHWTAGASVGIDDRVDNQTLRLSARINNEDDPNIEWRGSPSPIPFPLRTWVRVRLEVSSDRELRVYQDGVLVSQHYLGPKSTVGTVGGHWGLYGGASMRDMIVLNDNIKFELYGQPGPRYHEKGAFGETELPYSDDATHLNGPVGLGIEDANIWIVECPGHRALEYVNNGAFVAQLGKAGLNDTYGANLWCLQDVAIDSGGNIWIVSAAHSVSRFDPGGSRVGELGVMWETGSDNDHFNLPRSIAFDSVGHIYISDSGNHRIQVFDSDGAYLATIGVTGVPDSDNTHFNSPRHISVDSNDRLYVADAGNHRVQIFSVSNISTITYLATIGVSGVPGSDNAHFHVPQGVAVDVTHGKIYVADANNGRVQGFNYDTWAYQSTLAGFRYIADLAVDSAGNLYVAEPGESRVQQFTSNSNYVLTYGTTGVPYLTDGFHYNRPSGIAAAADGSIYIGEEAGQRLIKLSSDDVPQWIKGEAGIAGGDDAHFSSIEDVTLDAAGQVYVVDSGNCRVQIYGLDGSYYTTLGTGCGTGHYQFQNPYGVAVSPDGIIYVADTDNHRVQIYNSSLTYVATLGVTNLAGSDNSHFNLPKDVEVDLAGNIYVVDQNNDRLQIFNSDRAYIRTIGGTGVPQTDSNHLSRPTAVTVAANGRIFVADYSGERVQVFNSSGMLLTTIRGRGGNRTDPLHGVNGLAVDIAGNLYATEGEYHRVQQFVPSGT